jgi:hypothetical protein
VKEREAVSERPVRSEHTNVCRLNRQAKTDSFAFYPRSAMDHGSGEEDSCPDQTALNVSTLPVFDQGRVIGSPPPSGCAHPVASATAEENAASRSLTGSVTAGFENYAAKQPPTFRGRWVVPELSAETCQLGSQRMHTILPEAVDGACCRAAHGQRCDPVPPPPLFPTPPCLLMTVSHAAYFLSTFSFCACAKHSVH